MHGNFIEQTTTTTGTLNLTLSTVSGYGAFSDRFAESERFKYSILDSARLPLEAGIGYLSSGDLVREVIETTISSGTYDGSAPSALSLPAGTKIVICTGTGGSVLAAVPGIWSATQKSYGDAHICVGAGTVALTADRAYAVPFVAQVDGEIDAVQFRVTTAGAAGKLAKVSVWSVGANGLPGVKLAESSTIAVDSTGIKTGTFTRFRPPPRFFAALVCDGAPVVQSFAGGVLGSNAMGMDSSLIPIAFIHHVGATSTTFPTTWTAVANLSNASRPQLAVRVV